MLPSRADVAHAPQGGVHVSPDTRHLTHVTSQALARAACGNWDLQTGSVSARGVPAPPPSSLGPAPLQASWWPSRDGSQGHRSASLGVYATGAGAKFLPVGVGAPIRPSVPLISGQQGQKSVVLRREIRHFHPHGACAWSRVHGLWGNENDLVSNSPSSFMNPSLACLEFPSATSRSHPLLILIRLLFKRVFKSQTQRECWVRGLEGSRDPGASGASPRALSSAVVSLTRRLSVVSASQQSSGPVGGEQSAGSRPPGGALPLAPPDSRARGRLGGGGTPAPGHRLRKRSASLRGGLGHPCPLSEFQFPVCTDG